MRVNRIWYFEFSPRFAVLWFSAILSVSTADEQKGLFLGETDLSGAGQSKLSPWMAELTDLPLCQAQLEMDSSPLPCLDFLNIAEYLAQVSQKNESYLASENLQFSYIDQSQEGSFLFTPRFVSSIQAGFLENPQLIPNFPLFLQSATLSNQAYSIGFEQETPIGLDWKISSGTNRFQLKNSGSSSNQITEIFPIVAVPPIPGENFFGVANLDFASLISSQPTWSTIQGLNVKQHLWKNGFGEKTRAKARQLKHDALARAYQERYKLNSARIQSEGGYWQLVIARALTAIRREMVEESEQLLGYVERKRNESLALESEVYQARSVLISSYLELKNAQESETASALSFNSLRGISSPIVKECLMPLTSETLEMITPSIRGERNDLRANREIIEAQKAQAVVDLNEILPELDLNGSFGLQGVSTVFGESFNQSFTNPGLSASIYVTLSIPLSPYKMSSIKRSYKNKSKSLDQTYKRMKFEHDQGWDQLQVQLTENKRLIELLNKNIEIQREKFKNAKLEYERGLISFFTVTETQRDYQSAKITLLKTYQSILDIILNLSVYEMD